MVSQSFGMMQDWMVTGKESCVQSLKEQKQKTAGRRLNGYNQHYEVPILDEKKKPEIWDSVQVGEFFF